MKIHEMFGNNIDRTKYGVDNKLADSDTFLGIELEVEGVSGGSFIRRIDNFYWTVKGDGSLRNGCELVFKDPIKGSNITSALDDLDTCILDLKGIGKVPNLSSRTSMHVHLDVRDLDQKEVHELILLYMLFERLLFEYVGAYRIKNNYCRALVDSTFDRVLDRIAKCDNPNRYINLISDLCDKYSALNVRAISTFGSLEFRHHPGSFKSDEILPWINLILSLKLWIKQGNKVSSLLALEPMESISHVFGEYATPLLSLNYDDFYNANKGAVIKLINISDLRRDTSRILNRSSKAKTQLINQYVGVAV